MDPYFGEFDVCGRPMATWRFLRKARCGSYLSEREMCLTCRELSRFGGSNHRASGPCETVLSDLNYTESERAVVCNEQLRRKPENATRRITFYGFYSGYCGRVCQARV